MTCITQIAFSPLEFPLNLNFQFSSRECSRYYDSSTGKFLQIDPVAGRIASPITIINSYAYAGNNPGVHKDPSGKSFDEELLPIVAPDIHGNYCGYNARGQNGPPIDELDRACMRHDAAYDISLITSLEWDDSITRTKSDLGLFYEGIRSGDLQGAGVALFGNMMFNFYSAPMTAASITYVMGRDAVRVVGRVYDPNSKLGRVSISYTLGLGFLGFLL